MPTSSPHLRSTISPLRHSRTPATSRFVSSISTLHPTHRSQPSPQQIPTTSGYPKQPPPALPTQHSANPAPGWQHTPPPPVQLPHVSPTPPASIPSTPHPWPAPYPAQTTPPPTLPIPTYTPQATTGPQLVTNPYPMMLMAVICRFTPRTTSQGWIPGTTSTLATSRTSESPP